MMATALAHPPGCVRTIEQSLCPEFRIERRNKTATFSLNDFLDLKKFPKRPGGRVQKVLTHLQFCISY